MHWFAILRFLSFMSLFLSGAMAVSLAVSIIYGEANLLVILIPMASAAGTGILGLVLIPRQDNAVLGHRDGMIIVTLGWLTAGLIGTMPYILSGAVDNFTGAFFESVSGFSTTGASVISNVEAIPKSIAMWRSMTQWLGGMGIIVLSIAVLPFIGVGGMQLYRAETPSPVVDKLKPRISETARVLWKVYLLFTFLEIALLAAGGMDLFDAVNHTLCTVPTGGFSTKNTSIAHYQSAYFEIVIAFFMLICGVNFSIHYRFLRGDGGAFFKDAECRIYLGIVGVMVLLLSYDLYGTVFGSVWKSLRAAFFQVVSILTTTGFSTEDFDRWPALSKHVLVGCMFLGAMAGSTGGGMKIMRVVLLVKHAFQELFRLAHPHAVSPIKLGGRPVPAEVMGSIWGFSILYFLLFMIGTIVMCMLGMDLTSAFSSVASCIGNVGPGFGTVGPMLSYQSVPDSGKWILAFLMLVGRLEIYTILVLLTPEFWKR